MQKNDTGAVLGYDLMESLSDKKPGNRGIFDIDENGFVRELREVFDIDKTDLGASGLKCSDLCSMNIFALPPEIIGYISEEFARFKKEHAGDRKIEFLIPNEISNFVKNGKLSLKVYPNQEEWIGITYPEDEGVIREYLKKKHS